MTADPRHLGGDKYLVRIADGTKPNGQPWQAARTIRASSQREANRLAVKVAADLTDKLAAKKEQVRIESDPMALTVARLTSMWLGARRTEGVSPATLDQYETNAARWLPALGDRLAIDLTPVEIDVWVRGLTVKARTGNGVKPAAATTKRQAVNDLGQCLRFGGTKFPAHLPEKPITAAVTLPKHHVKRRAMPDVETLRDAVPMLLDEGPVGIAGVIAFGAGLRQGEVCALRWSALHSKRIWVTSAAKRHGDRIAAPKRESVRDIPISTIANEAFTAAAEWFANTSDEGSEWVLPSQQTGGPWNPSTLSHAWPAVAERAGLEGVTFHQLRHACGSLLLIEGVPLAQVSRALGHANPAITAKIYMHVLGRLGDEMWDGFNRATKRESSAP